MKIPGLMSNHRWPRRCRSRRPWYIVACHEASTKAPLRLGWASRFSARYASRRGAKHPNWAIRIGHGVRVVGDQFVWKCLGPFQKVASISEIRRQIHLRIFWACVPSAKPLVGRLISPIKTTVAIVIGQGAKLSAIAWARLTVE